MASARSPSSLTVAAQSGVGQSCEQVGVPSTEQQVSDGLSFVQSLLHVPQFLLSSVEMQVLLQHC
jgi:hypothetical protein